MIKISSVVESQQEVEWLLRLLQLTSQPKKEIPTRSLITRPEANSLIESFIFYSVYMNPHPSYCYIILGFVFSSCFSGFQRVL